MVEFSPKQIKFYSLMYVSDQKHNGAYLQKLDSNKRTEIYLRMALRLAKGVHSRFGMPLTLITNNQPLLVDVYSKFSSSEEMMCLAIEQVELVADIPVEARYFSATHKILLFDYFANRPEYSVLLDIDMICMNGDGRVLLDLMADGVAVTYTISEQVIPAHSYQRIYSDLSKFGPIRKDFRWFGGEFIGGSPPFFRELSDLAVKALPKYHEIFKFLHHQGDEIITTYCLNKMSETNPMLFVDIGPSDNVRRHHGKATLHDERRFRRISNLVFLHLPAAKSLLSSWLSDKAIIRFYLTAEILPRRLAGVFLAVIGVIVRP